MIEAAAFLKFLSDHFDLVKALWDAIDSGIVTKAEVLETIRQAQIAATDAGVKADLGPRT